MATWQELINGTGYVGIPQATTGTVNPQDPWGSSGNPLQAYEAEKQRIQGLNRTVGENQSYDDPTDPRNVMINGQSMFRLGDGSGLPVSADYLKQLQSGATYDPVHGFVVDPNLAAQAQLGSYTGSSGAGPLQGFNSKLNNFSTFGLSGKLEDKYPMLRNTDPIGKMVDEGKGPLVLASLFAGGALGGAFGGATAGAEGLGAGATGLTEGGLLASESGFLPGSFELGAGSGFGGGVAAPVGEGFGIGSVGGTQAGLGGQSAGLGLQAPAATTAPTGLVNTGIGSGGMGSTSLAGGTSGLGLTGGGVGTGGTMAATGAGGASALSRFLDGTASTQDWLSMLGTLGATGLGVAGSNKNADALRDIAAQSRADRAPFLNTSLQYLNDPAAYGAGPGKAAMDSTLGALSAKFGNPIGSGTALQIATDAGLRDWRNAVTGFANIGLSGEDSRNQLLAGAAGQDAGVYSTLGRGLGDLVSPRREMSLADIIKAYQLSGLA